MTFRESGSLDTSGVSGSGSGGRRPGGRGVAIGGVGGLVVVVLGLLFGVDVSELTGTSTTSSPASDTSRGSTASAIDQQIDACTLEKANRDILCRVVATTESLEDVWTAQLQKQTGMAYQHPETRIFEGQVSTACGAATQAVGPFYCPADRTVYLELGFFSRVLKRQLGGSDAGPSQMYVVAHEFGHHIQNQQGVLKASQADPQGPQSGAVRVELQADCYAGLWAHHATRTPGPGGEAPLLEKLTDRDIDDIIASAMAIGDDHIQKASGTSVNPDAWTHGSSKMRRQWFVEGYNNGSVERCNTFNARI